MAEVVGGTEAAGEAGTEVPAESRTEAAAEAGDPRADHLRSCPRCRGILLSFEDFRAHATRGPQPGEDARGIPATQIIFHQPGHSSYIDLPVIPT